MKWGCCLLLSLFFVNNSITEEIERVFLDFSIDDGLDGILQRDDMSFEYWKIPVPFSKDKYTETWESKLDEYHYLKNHNGRINFLLTKENTCLEMSISLFYESDSLLAIDYERVKFRFLECSAIIEECSILGLPLEFKNAKIDVGNEYREATFSFTMGNHIDEYNLTMNYHFCE